MKPPGALKRTAALARRVPLEAGKALERRTPLRARSKKRRREMAERRPFVADVLARRPFCEAGPALVDALGRGPAFRCQTWSVDVHEIKSRGRGGPIVPSKGLTEAGVLACCRWCHDWITDHPAQAEALDLLDTSTAPLR